MAMRPENLRFILGLKLRTLRQEQNASLKEVSERSGLSMSYLSEIEKGKKYPSPDKLLGLAEAFNVTYDDLVSLNVDDKLDPLKEMFSSPFIQEFPFELFGLAPHDVFSLVSDAPSKAGALIRTFLEVGRTYDMQVEHFLFAALRSYQQMHDNYFPDLEDAADAFRRQHDWPRTASLSDTTLRSLLEDEFGYTIDVDVLPNHDTLHPFRSVFVDGNGNPPTLYVNGDLMPIQRAFIYAREIGYNVLNVEERARTSSWIRAESFEQVLNNFKASYVAGALILNESSLLAALRSWFDEPAWDDGAFLRTQMDRFQATPEMLYYRLTQLVPHHFDLTAFFFLRFHHEQGSPDYHLTKMLNLSGIAVPHGIGLREHYCQRWPAIQLLKELSEAQAQDDYTHDPSNASAAVRAQRSHFINADAEFFTLSTARPLALKDTTNSCVSIGFLMDDAFRRQVQFAHDPAITRREVNLTCERCPLTHAQCQERVAPRTLYDKEQREQQQIEALRELTNTTRSA